MSKFHGTNTGNLPVVIHGKGKSGSGWKSGVGGTLIGLGTLGGLGNIGTKSIEGLIGGAILSGLGATLIHFDKKKGKKQSGSGKTVFDKNFIKHLRKTLRQKQVGGAMTAAGLKKLLGTHANTPISIKHIFGKEWKKRGKELLRVVKEQRGGNIFDDIGKGIKGAYNASKKKLTQFVEGKTKFKPSTLLNVMAGAVGLAGTASAFIPGVDLISVPAAAAASLGLKSAAHLVKTSGRGKPKKGKGLKLAGTGKHGKGLATAGAGLNPAGGQFITQNEQEDD